MKKYNINQWLNYIIIGEEILVKQGVYSDYSFYIKPSEKKEGEDLIEIFNFFKKPKTMKELEEFCQKRKIDYSKAENIVSFLKERKILIASEENILEIYLKSILGKEKISSKKILLIGSGYLGSRIISQLIRLNSEGVTVVDNRKIENLKIEKNFFDIPSNFFKEKTFYIDIIKNYLESEGYQNVVFKKTSFEDLEGLKNLAQNHDFIISSIERWNPMVLHLINKIAIETRKPWISNFCDGNQGVVGPLYIPGESCCYNEFEIQKEACIRLKDEYFLYKEYVQELENKIDLVFPPYLEMIANVTLNFVLQFLSSQTSFLLNKVIFINFEDFSIIPQNLLKLPRCPACRDLYSPYISSFG